MQMTTMWREKFEYKIIIEMFRPDREYLENFRKK